MNYNVNIWFRQNLWLEWCNMSQEEDYLLADYQGAANEHKTVKCLKKYVSDDIMNYIIQLHDRRILLSGEGGFTVLSPSTFN